MKMPMRSPQLTAKGMAVGMKVASGLGMLVWFLLDWLYPVVFEAGDFNRRYLETKKTKMGHLI